ncbi:MAG: lipid-A-disaccharide synthase [Candidatus Omnitrophica bacterium]|nr:lipid-A-disaccharide synthase [Candidatus Omnitrophota bacterium]
MKSLKIFFIACEASGDTHGAHLIEQLRLLDPEIQITGLGGPRMKRSGMPLLKDMTNLSALGLGDVLRQYFVYRRIFYGALEEVRKFKPDVIVVIDSPAFNLRFAKKIYKEFPVIYYISPQIWAWGGRRIHTIKRTISKMLCILPFEEEIYEKAGVPCEFVGHPLLDEIPAASENRAGLRKEWKIPEYRLAIGLLPGSREKEVKRILPVMLKSAALLKNEFPEACFFIMRSPNVSRKIYDSLLIQYPGLDIRFQDYSHSLVASLDFALVTSGTATLETTLLGVPFFLLYKTGWTTYFLGRQLVRVKFLGLTNLLAGKNVVPEFIQRDANPKAIAQKAIKLLSDQQAMDNMREELLEIREKLGEKGASLRAARTIYAFALSRCSQENSG